MNNEIIVLIACFVTSIVVSVFIAMFTILMFKRIMNNSGPNNNNNVYNTEQIKELLTKYCASDAIITKRILEHPSTANESSDISHELIVKTRLAESSISIVEAIKCGTECKTLREFADWLYKFWGNWNEINTYLYSDIPDIRIGWRQTWIVVAYVCSDNNTKPVAFTDKPFYNLKLNAVDAKYIRSKYPKFLECVYNLRVGDKYETRS